MGKFSNTLMFWGEKGLIFPCHSSALCHMAGADIRPCLWGPIMVLDFQRVIFGREAQSTSQQRENVALHLR